MKKIELFLYSPLYPLLFSIYPVLSMFSINYFQSYAYAIITPLIISFLLGLMSLLIYKIWFKEWHFSAFASSVTLLLFYSYGHILNSVPFASKYLYNFLPGIWIVLFISAIWGISHLRGKIVFSTYAPALNVTAIILLLFPIIHFLYVGFLSVQPLAFQANHFVDLSKANTESKPDIYYIILDGYGRSDFLYKELSYDNTGFLDSLTDMGFKVSNCSQSNYPNTELSLVSALNLDYIQNLGPVFLEEKDNFFNLVKALKGNSVVKSLKNVGYTTITFPSGFPWSEPNVDHLINPSEITSINEFDVLFMRTTFLRVIDQFIYPLFSITDLRYRQRLEFVLNSHDELSQIPGPKFVFMHILSSHNPYVLDHNGYAISPEYRNSRVGYIEQTKYSSRALVDLVGKIISTSKTPPVIVIQGDHGAFLLDKDTNSFLILNAYFLPDHSTPIYSTISPVNTFRIIFNEYFDMNLPLLEDISYLPDKTNAANFSTVPNDCNGEISK